MPQSPVFRVSDLPQNSATPFELRPSADARKELARELNVPELRKVRFAGEIRAKGKRDWELVATLGATIVQNCVITLDPVTTRIDDKVTRTFLADLPEATEEEVEMTEDDTTEPLGSEIDVAQVMTEALALVVPEFPRKEGVELGEAVYAEPGIQPLRDEDARPFAGLAALKQSLESKD